MGTLLPCLGEVRLPDSAFERQTCGQVVAQLRH